MNEKNLPLYRWAKYHLSRPKCRDCSQFARIKRIHKSGDETFHCLEHDVYNQAQFVAISPEGSSVEDSLEQLANAFIEFCETQ